MLIDTDIIIWYMRGNENALEIIESQSSFHISVVTYIELIQGMRNKSELGELRKAFRIWNTKILYVTEDISSKALFYIERNFLSHSLQLADALIGSTALVNGLVLFTGNDKHYRMIKELNIKVFRP